VAVEHHLRRGLQFLGPLRKLGARPAPMLGRVTGQLDSLGGQVDTLDYRLYSSMRVPLLTLAEYAGVDSTGKLFIAGVAEGVSLQRKQGVPADIVGPVQIPPLFLVAIVEASIVDGTTHSVGIQVVNEDRKDVAPANQLGVFHFQINKHGRPMRAQVVAKLQGLTVPGPGDYELLLLVDEKEVATTPLYVTDDTPESAQ